MTRKGAVRGRMESKRASAPLTSATWNPLTAKRCATPTAENRCLNSRVMALRSLTVSEANTACSSAERRSCPSRSTTRPCTSRAACCHCDGCVRPGSSSRRSAKAVDCMAKKTVRHASTTPMIFGVAKRSSRGASPRRREHASTTTAGINSRTDHC